MTDQTTALRALLGDTTLGVFATLRRDGRPQLSTVSYIYRDGLIQVSTVESRAKVANLRRDPRASLHANSPDGGRSYVVADGTAELSPVAADPHDAVVEELVDVFRAIQGEHPDWTEYREAMVQDRRLVVRLSVDHLYGLIR